MSSGPALVSVKYTNIKPQEKTGDYKAGDRCTFVLDPAEVAYVDGRQSYLYVEVENNSTYSNVNATAVPPTCFYAHLGGHALFDRMTLRGLNGQELEDMDASSLYKGLQSYLHDYDEFPTMAKVEGIAAHTPRPKNVVCSDPKVNQFLPPAAYNTNSKTFSGGNNYLKISKCLPVPFGLWSAFQNEHKVYPNASILGSKIEYYLADPKQVLQDMAGRYVDTTTADPRELFTFASNPVDCENITGADPLNEVLLTNTSTAGNEWNPDEVVFRVGMPVTLEYTVDSNALTHEAIITAITADQGVLNNQLRLTLDSALSKGGFVGDVESLTVQGGEVNYDYTVTKIELRVLETMPNDPKAVDAAVSKGVNYHTYQLTKQSMPAGLKNQVINIPSSLTRAKSILLTHNVSDDLNEVNFNSTVYPQLEENLDNVRYQWQVRNHLTPNRSVLLSTDPNVNTDNTIWYLEMSKAVRPMGVLRALNDGLPRYHGDTDEYDDLQLPMCYPLLLAPVRNTYSLVNAEPQLRLENSNGADTKARLYHIFINHVRTLRRDGDSLVVEL